MLMVHVVASIAAIVTGFGVLMAAKGTERHRALGTMYVVATYVLCGSSFFVFQVSGRLSLRAKSFGDSGSGQFECWAFERRTSRAA
jgi:uncharacterized membrane protein